MQIEKITIEDAFTTLKEESLNCNKKLISSRLSLLKLLKEQNLISSDEEKEFNNNTDVYIKAGQILDKIFEKSETKRPVFENKLLLCPSCHCRIKPKHSYCHRCGQALNHERVTVKVKISGAHHG